MSSAHTAQGHAPRSYSPMDGPGARETEAPVRHAGFADPVHDAQRFFRVLLTALSRPCQPQALPARLPEAPTPLAPAVAAALLTLCDGDTPLWLAPEYDTPQVRAWLRFHTACPLVGDPAKAAFAAAPSFAALTPHAHQPSHADHTPSTPLAAFAQGQPAFPDQSTTLLVGVGEIDGMPVPGGTAFAAAGPGIQERAVLALPPDALPRNFDHLWAANTAAWPLGVDMLLLAPGHVLGLPRTTRLTPLSQPL